MKLGFLDFMLVGVPIVIVGIPVAWLLLTRVTFRVHGGTALVETETLAIQRRELGQATQPEKFVRSWPITAFAWSASVDLSVIPGLTEP